ncbi:MAG: sodium:proton exchanger [Bacteroidetes bacterium]|jgi:Kef-type K+ transport system membrane component KefB|nr:sodium:proton exchanger [Bacteroidota bacterium]
MNLFLTIGTLLIVGYAAGWLIEKTGLPRIIAYIGTGIVFSPHTAGVTETATLQSTAPLLEIALAFIAFEVGGALEWGKIKAHRKAITSITVLASLSPFIIITFGVLAFGYFWPEQLSFSFTVLLLLGLMLGALASPTDPTATFAVMHQYKAKGDVSDTIVGVAALDDALGVLLFSLTINTVSIYLVGTEGDADNHSIGGALYQIVGSIGLGAIVGLVIRPIARLLQTDREGQWVVIIFALLIFVVGVSQWLGLEKVLTAMSMGIVVANTCPQREVVFGILERYTEELIFLFFFLLSGLQLDVHTLPQAAGLIALFIVLRTIGKILGADIGARVVQAAPTVRKYTAFGLLPQGGIVIGLALSLQDMPAFAAISNLLLNTIMGTTVLHELAGPIAAKWGLKKAGEI